MFFKKIYVSEGKIVKYDLSDEINDLIKNGSIRVRKDGLEKWNRFGINKLQINTY